MTRDDILAEVKKRSFTQPGTKIVDGSKITDFAFEMVQRHNEELQQRALEISNIKLGNVIIDFIRKAKP